MKLYSAVINLSGNAKNQVRKNDLTATEICILTKIHEGGEHSDPPMVEIVETGEVDRSDAEERARLIGRGENDSPALYSVEYYRSVFASDFVPLPQAIAPELLAKKPVPTIVPDKPLSSADIDKEIARLQSLKGGSAHSSMME